MLWIVLLVVFAVVFIGGIMIISNIDYTYDIPGAMCLISGFFGIIISIIGICRFTYDKMTYPVKIAGYNQKYELITEKLDTFAGNANTSEQFASAYNDAYSYNIDLYKKQNTYKCIGCLFDYNNKEILKIKLIDISTYKIRDTDMNIKLKEAK
jgi:hypothetical protein